MNTSVLRRAPVILTAAAVLVASGTPSLAGPSGVADRVQQQVQTYRAAHPGGKQINATEISYGGGLLVVAVVRAARQPDGPDCPGGWYCFYDGVNFAYPRGRISGCGWQDLAWWGWHDRIESVHDNLAGGTVWFVDHGDVNHSGDRSLFSVDTVLRMRFDVAPYRNLADHVYRYC